MKYATTMSICNDVNGYVSTGLTVDTSTRKVLQTGLKSSYPVLNE